MKIFLTCLITAGTFIFSCNKKDDASPALAYTAPMEGEYRGIKIFSKTEQGQVSPGDTVKISLTVSQQDGGAIRIKGMVPTEEVVTARIGDLNIFSYDRGKGIDQCGVTSMTGEGYFRGDSLFITETVRCTTANSPDLSRTSLIKAVKVR